MEELINQLQVITYKFMSCIDEAESEEVEQFVEQREAIINKIREFEGTVELLEKHKAVIRKIIQLDPQVTRKISVLLNAASQGIKGLQQANVQRNAYDSNPLSESHFFDRKK